MGKKIFAIMLVVFILCSIIFVPASAEYIPGYFDPTAPFNKEMIQSIYYTIYNILGFHSTVNDTTISGQLDPFDIGWGTTINDWTNLILDTTVQQLYNNIKEYFVQDGTITYSNGRSVPRWKLEITAENANDVKLFAKSVQDFAESYYNEYLQNNFVWTDINHIYGGYLSYANEFVGNTLYYSQSTTKNQYDTFHVNNNIYLRSYGLDLYFNVSNTYAPFLLFDSTNDTVVVVQNPPSSPNILNRQNTTVYYYAAFPFRLKGNAAVQLTMNKAVTASDGPWRYWSHITLMTAEQYSDWLTYLDEHQYVTGVPTPALATAYYSTSADDVASYNCEAGDYYIIARLYIGSHGTTRGIQSNISYNLENSFDIQIGNYTIFNVQQLNGLNRTYGWSVDITDSGTGTTTTIPDALYTLEDGVFDVGSVLYFPGYAETVNDVDEIINSDVALTGVIADPSTIDPSNNETPVNIDLVPPTTLGLASIWHYVSDTAIYCASFLSVLVGNIFSIIPTPIFNIAFAAVVLGILFGLYKRFIE